MKEKRVNHQKAVHLIQFLKVIQSSKQKDYQNTFFSNVKLNLLTFLHESSE